MALIQQQDFNAADGSNLANRAMQVGGGLLAVGDVDHLIAINGRARLSGARTNGIAIFPTVSGQDYVVRVIARLLSTSNAPVLRVRGRMTGFSGANQFEVRVSATGVQLIESKDFTDRTIASAANSFALNTDYVIELVLNGAAISARIDASTVVSGAGDATITGTNVGLSFEQSAVGSDTTGWHVDVMEVDDTIPGAAATSEPCELVNGALLTSLIH